MIKSPLQRRRVLSIHKPRKALQRRRSAWRQAFDWLLVVLLFTLCALLAVRLERIPTVTSQGMATIHDGDTITIGGERLRLRGMDAFEIGQQCNRGTQTYDCGRAARRALDELVARRSVRCAVSGRDRYGRGLAECTVGGISLNAALVEAGWAVAYGGFAAEEAAARKAGRGAWAGAFDRPDRWRATHGGMAEPRHDVLMTVLGWLRGFFGGDDVEGE